MEVLLASIIFASVIGGLAAAWTFQERSIKKYRNRNAARMLIEQEMARLTAHTYSNLQDAARDTTLTLNREVDGVVTSKSFESKTEVIENADKTLKDITMTLTFTEQNEQKSMVLRTRVYRSE
jgi:hypothetical protein